MYTEILSMTILAILGLITALTCLVVAFICLGNASYFLKPYREMLESKQERIALVKLSLWLGGLLLLCKYL